MSNYTIWLLPVISAFIGWFTNWIAIKMLFHPRNPVKILGFTVQGIFPKRQRQFAIKLGQMVAGELLHFDQITEKLKDPAQLETLKPSIEKHIDDFLHVRLKERIPMLAMFAGESTLSKIKTGLQEEIDLLLPEVIGQYTDSISRQIDIEQMVTEKVTAFSSDKLEQILVQIMNKELRFVEILGGVLGFLIGIVQVLLAMI